MSRHDDLRRRFAGGGILFDGGLGTMLIASGLGAGAPPEEWNLTNPDTLSRIHGAYLEAGSHIISSNTFGASPSRLQSHELGGRLREINTAGVRLASDAVDKYTSADPDRARGEGRRLVALSVGPSGKMLPPVGQASEAEIRSEFAAQFQSIDADFDLVLIETIFDLKEGLTALDVAKNTLPHPVAVSLTYDKKPRGFFTVMGDEASAAAGELERAGADIIGANCSIASGDMLELAEVLKRSTELPILCQPNAGEPTMRYRTPVYDQAPDDFAKDAILLFEKGIHAVGGCCGTTPDFIRQVSRRLR
jgi:methionine synthase I (cobalamin-dependent)